MDNKGNSRPGLPTYTDLGFDEYGRKDGGLDSLNKPTQEEASYQHEHISRMNKLKLEEDLLKLQIEKQKLENARSVTGLPPLIVDEDKSKLLSVFPKSKTYKTVRALAVLLLSNENGIDNYLLAQKVNPTVLKNNKRKKLTKSDFLYKKTTYLEEIENRIRTIRRYWKPLGYTIKFQQNVSSVIKKPIPHSS